MKLLRFWMSASTIGLLLFALAPSTSAQYPQWLHGATGFARAIELQRELNVSLVLYFYTDGCSDCRTLDDQYLSAPSVHRALQRSVAVRINPNYGPEERQIADRYGVTSYPTFLVMDNQSAPPRNVQPFRPDGNNLTPDQFARACEKAMTFLPMPPKVIRDDSRDSMERMNNRAVMNATRQARSAQIVEVRSGTATSLTEPKVNPLPAMDAILTKHLAAIGGSEAQQKLRSRVIKGRLELVGGDSWGQLSIYTKAPNKSFAVINLQPVGQVKHGYDGNTAWDAGGALGSHNLTGVALSGFSNDTDFYRESKLRELYPTIRVLGIVKDKDREFYLVEAFPRVGVAETLFFESQTGLLTGRDLTQQTPQGPVRVEMRYSDWREVDGVKLPFKITQTMPGLKFVFTVTELKHNMSLADSLFEQP